MNKQGKSGIGWCDYTWNPIAGCLHDCMWTMPTGDTAQCYAKGVAEGLAAKAYPDGFAHNYYHPHRLNEPNKDKQPSRIFIDSMSDLFGAWVPKEQIKSVLSTCANYPQHTFIALTKNPGRLAKFSKYMSGNMWILVSSPPDYMNGNKLTLRAKYAYVYKSLQAIKSLPVPVVGMSVEPLSFDIADIMKSEKNNMRLNWCIIGAASNGRKVYQPASQHVNNLLSLLADMNTRIYMKANLHWQPRLQDYPL